MRFHASSAARDLIDRRTASMVYGVDDIVDLGHSRASIHRIWFEGVSSSLH
jgi:hypothetical protein